MDPHVAECDDCRSRRDEYARLAAALALGSTRPLPSDWKERTLARWHRERACRRRRAGLAGGVAAAAAVALIFALRERDAVRAEPELALSFEKGPGTWRGPAHHPGDRVIAAPTASAPHFELRLYLERELLARCPGGSASPARPDRESAAGGAREAASPARCRPKGDVVELSYELARSGD